MLEMPKLIRAWKSVRISSLPLIFLYTRRIANPETHNRSGRGTGPSSRNKRHDAGKRPPCPGEYVHTPCISMYNNEKRIYRFTSSSLHLLFSCDSSGFPSCHRSKGSSTSRDLDMSKFAASSIFQAKHPKAHICKRIPSSPYKHLILLISCQHLRLPQLMALSSPSHYEVLNLTPTILNSQHDPSTLIKQAYRRALLRHHPDKAAAAATPSVSSSVSPSSQTRPSHSQLYTIDQITQAFTILSSPRQRSTYDASLRLTRANGDESQARFQTGIENVDLDDLQFDEGEERWYRPCRCGNDRGYSFEETDLEEVEHEGVLMVGCHDCSLWLKVHFAVVEDAADDSHSSALNKNEPS